MRVLGPAWGKSESSSHTYHSSNFFSLNYSIRQATIFWGEHDLSPIKNRVSAQEDEKILELANGGGWTTL